MLTPPKDRVVVIKADDTNSLNTLEQFCEQEENRLLSKLVKIELGKLDDGTKLNVLTLNPRKPGMVVGNLTISAFKNEVDKQSIIAIQRTTDEQTNDEQTNDEPLVCEGKAYVDGKIINVLVFRKPD